MSKANNKPAAKRSRQAPRPHSRHNKLQARANNEELQTLLTKAHLYAGGNMSLFLLNAGLAYRPLRKGEGRKA